MFFFSCPHHAGSNHVLISSILISYWSQSCLVFNYQVFQHHIGDNHVILFPYHAGNIHVQFSIWHWIQLQWCTFSSVSGHRPIKSPKTKRSNSPQDLSPIKIQFWWSCVPLFLWCCGQACYYFPTKFKPRFSARHVNQRTWTAEAQCFSWSEWPCIMHGQSALCFFFVGSIAERKPLYSSCSRTERQWCELQLFLFCS